MTTAEKMKQKMVTAARVNAELAAMISANGGGATSITAIMFHNASRDLVSLRNKVRNLLASGEITTDEYKYIMDIES